MVAPGDIAPEFTAPIATDEIEQFSLSEAIGDGPIVLAFFPAAFSNTCTDEMCTLRDDLGEFDDLGATVYGISTDLPHALSAWRDQLDLQFPLVSDADGSISRAYGVESSFDSLGLDPVSRRSVFVIDEDGMITYRWLADNPGLEPDYEDVKAAVEAI